MIAHMTPRLEVARAQFRDLTDKFNANLFGQALTRVILMSPIDLHPLMQEFQDDMAVILAGIVGVQPERETYDRQVTEQPGLRWGTFVVLPPQGEDGPKVFLNDVEI